MEKEQNGGGAVGEELRILFPEERQRFWQETVRQAQQVQEIRLRVGRPVLVKKADGEFYLDENGYFTDKQNRAHIADGAELEQLLCHICSDSPYAYEDELRQGFITAPGGHRVGLAGQVVLAADGSVRTIKHICFINIRVAHQMFGAADSILPRIYSAGELQNVLIISPPGCGKTTLLRELVRRISDGNPYGRGLTVGVVDERSELAGSYLGKPQNDLGSRTDVLDACPKALGMMLLLRAMSPQVIAVDELGGDGDMAALKAASACGSHILATVHGENPADVARKFPELQQNRIFGCLLVLGRREGQPVVRRIYRGEEAELAFSGRNDDRGRLSGLGTVAPEPADRKAAFPAGACRFAGDVYERDTLW